MLINSFILAISSSIDSLGIGITYGIRNTNISILGKIFLFWFLFLFLFFLSGLEILLKLYFQNGLLNLLVALFFL